jgi:Glycosyl hydrolase family 26
MRRPNQTAMVNIGLRSQRASRRSLSFTEWRPTSSRSIGAVALTMAGMMLALLACTVDQPIPSRTDGWHALAAGKSGLAPAVDKGRRPPAFGAFLGSDVSGVNLIPRFEEWLGGRQVTVGRTYLPPNRWEDVRGPEFILRPWTQWRAGRPKRMLILNVPMLIPNETSMSDSEVAALLARGASGEFDEHFRVLGQRLVSLAAANTIIVLGWEMNGTTYTSRCAPDPAAWRTYWRSIVKTMRSVPGQRFRFDFAPTRGANSIPWERCYPGDDVVDIIGMDTYDQAPGNDFYDYLSQPSGLQDQVDFATKHGKPISFPEWGLFRYGDRPEYIRAMHEWITTHNVVYHTISDYCPHGIWRCKDNPKSSATFRELFGAPGGWGRHKFADELTAAAAARPEQAQATLTTFTARYRRVQVGRGRGQDILI